MFNVTYSYKFSNGERAMRTRTMDEAELLDIIRLVPAGDYGYIVHNISPA